ncbi:cytochrome c oxidase subunit 6b-2-like [Andrographis paniculata]|uniref:cytochrome c oxidase subunit 6b-2-like n=1 Tax=Andrographis paniculata TaxID=175694 RepID=UPI0021E887C4|nr:cytochrome c oxidase subunit 6b-2-like [Andrographis paniculata]
MSPSFCFLTAILFLRDNYKIKINAPLHFSSFDSFEPFEAEISRRSPLAEIELKTAPADVRFPTTNQTRHCFTRYIEFNTCVAAKGEGAGDCEKFAKYYRALCPGEWIERWNEQRENGTFPGPL